MRRRAVSEQRLCVIDALMKTKTALTSTHQPVLIGTRTGDRGVKKLRGALCNRLTAMLPGQSSLPGPKHWPCSLSTGPIAGRARRHTRTKYSIESSKEDSWPVRNGGARDGVWGVPWLRVWHCRVGAEFRSPSQPAWEPESLPTGVGYVRFAKRFSVGRRRPRTEKRRCATADARSGLNMGPSLVPTSRVPDWEGGDVLYVLTLRTTLCKAAKILLAPASRFTCQQLIFQEHFSQEMI
jgi:hypothetical protein